MKILLLLTFPLVILLTGVVCGQCPNFGKMASFHKEGLIKERYLGKWYQQSRHRSMADLPGKCWTQTYTKIVPNDPLLLNLKLEYFSEESKSVHDKNYEIRITNFNEPNLLQYYANPTSPMTYRVLATDYVTFAIEYTCQDKKEHIWIFTRRKHPPERVMKRAYKAIRALGLKASNLQRTNQFCYGKGDRIRRPQPRKLTKKASKKVSIGNHPTAKLTSRLSADFGTFLRTVFAPWSLPRFRHKFQRRRLMKRRRRKKMRHKNGK